jgi:hypothetical protein
MCHIVKHSRMKYKLKQSYWKKKILAYKPKKRLSQKMKHKYQNGEASIEMHYVGYFIV